MRPSPQARKRARQRAAGRAREPGREEWQKRRSGDCAACGQRGPVVWHHVVKEGLVRKFAGDPWDQRNALQLGAPMVWGGLCSPNCHDGHHHPGVKDTRLPMRVVPAQAVAFARELMGDDLARAYFQRSYRCD